MADEVSRLQRGGDAECRLFQKFAEQGHYGGRTYPSNTRQGTYAATPSGIFLASINANQPVAVADMMRRALEKWKTLPRDQRLMADAAPSQAGNLIRAERFYPVGGLVLQVHSRDLPREQASAEQGNRWYGQAWNNDFAWFTKVEARQLLPPTVATGARHEVPETLVRRIARLCIVDNVRGQTEPYSDSDVKEARMSAAVQKVDGDIASLRLEGQTKTNREGMWSIAGYRDMERPSQQKRGIETRLLGNAKFDLKAERFVSFELVALGTRTGATQYNGRQNDSGPAPIGFAFTLAGDKPAEHVAPAHFWGYGWR